MAPRSRFQCECGANWDRTIPARSVKVCMRGHEAPIKMDGPASKPEPTPNGQTPGLSAIKLYSARELMALKLPGIRWAVEDMVPEGLDMVIGKPKLGKSWLVFGLAVACVCGGRALGQIEVDEGDVLYLALEDGERRLQSRLRDILGTASPP